VSGAGRAASQAVRAEVPTASPVRRRASSEPRQRGFTLPAAPMAMATGHPSAPSRKRRASPGQSAETTFASPRHTFPWAP